MIRRYITYTALGVVFMFAWNIFLIQRDEKMYDAYYRQQAVQQQQR